ncbi:glycerate kinase-like [Venturia canescens]|uniref:glycerate kinase-like n=1 Tax=Venturia canescens TaxID=32260 RepID=UPI001C9CFA14|nr:glycerate kinase-like [Venturia canescens]
MRRKRAVKRKKRIKAEITNNEVTIARLQAAKLKREETIAVVKRRLKEKFNERFALTRANTFDSEREHRNLFVDKTECSPEKLMAKIREEMKSVMVAGVRKVHASKVLEEKVKYDAKTSTMTITGKKYKLKKNVHVVGWGREALMMSSALERIIGNNLKKGFVVVPRRTIASMSIYPELFPRLNTRIHLTEAQSDEIPDDVCARATKTIADYCKKLKKKDILVVLLSRGSDKLLCQPRGTVGLTEKMLVLELLRKAGATIYEIETVRNTLSAIRGGRLAELAHPAKVISLVMSDLGANELNLKHVSGGPTIKADHRASITTARSILDKYGLHAHKLAQSIREILKDHQESTSKESDKPFQSFVDNYVVASSKEALDGMAVGAFRHGYVPIKITATSALSSNTTSNILRTVSKDYARLVSLMILAVEEKITRTEMYRDICENIVTFDLTEKMFLEIFPRKENWAHGLYLLICPPSSFMANQTRSRETEESVARLLRTGNNQELAIYFSLDWYLRVERYPILREYIVWFLGGASDGHDGNTDHAGAYAYGNLAVDVYRKFKNNVAYTSTANDRVDAEYLRAEKRAVHESVLPHCVLTSGNANLFFLNVNAGEELLKLSDANGSTQTQVGDLHLVRIVRCQCCCSGLCTKP